MRRTRLNGYMRVVTSRLCKTSQNCSIVFYTGLTVFVDNKDITRWFNSSNVDDDADYTGLSITKKNTTQLIVAFKSGGTYVCRTNRNYMERVKYCDVIVSSKQQCWCWCTLQVMPWLLCKAEFSNKFIHFFRVRPVHMITNSTDVQSRHYILAYICLAANRC